MHFCIVCFSSKIYFALVYLALVLGQIQGQSALNQAVHSMETIKKSLISINKRENILHLVS